MRAVVAAIGFVAFIAASARGADAACTPPPVGLTDWWPGNGTASDVVGSHDAMLQGNATFAAGLDGQTFLLDGASFVSAADAPDVGSGDFTVDLWVKFASTAGEQVLVEKYVETMDASTALGWTFSKRSDDSLIFAQPNGAGASTAPLAIPVDTWIHFAARRGGTTNSIFVDGTLVASASDDPAQNLTSTASLKLGHRGNPSDTPGSLDTRDFFLTGEIDEVHYFVGRALDDAEIEGIHAVGADGVCFASCGDGTVQAGEDCDLGGANGSPLSCCSATCTVEPLGTVCRVAAGACDVAETCDGTNAVCPADAFLSAATVCRSAAGACDAEERCTGSSADCPADDKQPGGTVCRAAAGICDTAETCDGASDDCPADAFASSTTVCRGSAGECDVAETCTGSSAACPADSVKPTNTTCTDDGNVCTRDVCNGTAVTCTHPAGNPGTVCRVSAGVCDVAETCTGSSTACPANVLAPSSTVCRPAAGVCDLPESCTGTSAACPTDAVQPSNHVCRPAAGVCDAAETCDGAGVACPTDRFRPSTFTCRDSTGECDPAEHCTGAATSCPANAFSASGTACSDEGNLCTLDACNGAGACTHTPTADSDGDGACDAIDPCTNTGGQGFLSTPKSQLLLANINTDSIPNNDQVKISGTFELPAGRSFSDLHPDTRGGRVVIESVNGSSLIDATLATGLYTSTSGRGWKRSGSGKSWTYRDRTGLLASGVTKVTFYDLHTVFAPHLARLLVVGKGGVFPVAETDSPIQAQVTLGNQTDAAAGLCAETSYGAGDCSFNLFRNMLNCRK